MGFSLSWLAVQGGARDMVLGTLGLRGTGRREQIHEAGIAGVELPSGWYVVIATSDHPALMEDRTLARLSLAFEVATCIIEEHTMLSSASAWHGGRRIWLVLHDANRGIEHLQLEGSPPAAFASIRDRLCAKQKAAGGGKAKADHIFDIPVELAEGLTGYRHDRDIPGLGGTPFEVLETTATAPKRPWLRRLLGV